MSMAKLKINCNYGVAPISLLNNSNLSAKAKGLFVYIQSKPDGWNFSAERIANDFKDKIDSIRTGILELEKYGYLTRVKYQDGNGHWGIEYNLYEQPVKENPTQEKPILDFPMKEKQVNNSNKDLSKRDLVIKKEKTDIFFESIFEIYKKNTPVGSHKSKAKEQFQKLTDIQQQKLHEYLKEFVRRRQKILAAKGWVKNLPAMERFIRNREFENVDLPELEETQTKKSSIKIFRG